MALPKARQGMRVEPNMAVFEPGCAALVFYSYLRQALQHWLLLLRTTDIDLPSFSFYLVCFASLCFASLLNAQSYFHLAAI